MNKDVIQSLTRDITISECPHVHSKNTHKAGRENQRPFVPIGQISSRRRAGSAVNTAKPRT